MFGVLELKLERRREEEQEVKKEEEEEERRLWRNKKKNETKEVKMLRFKMLSLWVSLASVLLKNGSMMEYSFGLVLLLCFVLILIQCPVEIDSKCSSKRIVYRRLRLKLPVIATRNIRVIEKLNFPMHVLVGVPFFFNIPVKVECKKQRSSRTFLQFHDFDPDVQRQQEQSEAPQQTQHEEKEREEENEDEEDEVLQPIFDDSNFIPESVDPPPSPTPPLSISQQER